MGKDIESGGAAAQSNLLVYKESAWISEIPYHVFAATLPTTHSYESTQSTGISNDIEKSSTDRKRKIRKKAKKNTGYSFASISWFDLLAPPETET